MASHQRGGRRSLAAWCAALASLGGCPTVDLGDTPTDINLCNPPGGAEYFAATIYPTYLHADDTANGCARGAGCHNEGGGNALSLRIGARRDDAFNFRQAQVFLNCGTPAMSTLLTRPIDSSDPHGGGDLYSAGDAEVQAFLGWFQ